MAVNKRSSRCLKFSNASMIKASHNMLATIYVTKCKPLKNDRYFIAKGKRAMIVPSDCVLAPCSLRDKTVKLTMPTAFAAEFV